MSNIQISDITNSTDTSEGTGVFDTLIQSVERLIITQFNDSRISGTDYATVYLGALQSVLQVATSFVLEEQAAGLKADLLVKQVLQEEEKIDLITAQTADAYEKITASQADTARKNLLNNKEVINLGHKADLIQAQTLGFKNDTKQKILKLMLDGYAVNLSVSGTADAPETTKDAAIDQMAQDIIDSLDISPGVTIQSITQTPDDGSTDGAPT